jgi:hypothetical protein
MIKNIEFDDSKVEVTNLDNGIGIIAKKYIAEGETVYEERCEVFHELTNADFSDPACDACFLVRKIIQDPQAGRLYDEFCFDSTCVHASKPTRDDKRFLRKLSKKSKVSYDKTLGLFKAVCAYNVRVFLESPLNKKIRIQLSKLVNRTNHSCNPNTSVLNMFLTESDFNTRVLIVQAIRPIQKGEEVTFSYINLRIASTLDFNSRRAEIKSLFGFSCNCEKCLEESRQSFHSIL